LAEDAGVQLVRPGHVQVTSLDESGVDVRLDAQQHRTTALLLAGELPGEQRRALGMPDSWDEEVLHRYTFLRLRGARWIEPSLRQVIAMSLDLRGTLNWGWLLPGPSCVQVCVDQPINTVHELPPTQLLKHWIDVLERHGVLKVHGSPIDPGSAQSLDLPLAGALVQEGVANRTLLIGPAGGFFTACAEDIYPNCWSALFAADVMKKALKERHLQDALQPYRHKWGATLGDYLRGPQQNLRFLLPLVYRNSTMTTRLAEAILFGKSVVR
jgi:flavin-dependent dehydrogenase